MRSPARAVRQKFDPKKLLMAKEEYDLACQEPYSLSKLVRFFPIATQAGEIVTNKTARQ